MSLVEHVKVDTTIVSLKLLDKDVPPWLLVISKLVLEEKVWLDLLERTSALQEAWER